jgi:transposase-like protein
MKGDYKGLCNFSSCKSNKLATWYHFSTQKYYCEDCARMLNRENKRDAMELYGHDLLVFIE